MQRNFVFPMFEQTRWTGPYVFCPLNGNQWLVSSIQPIWASNHLNYKNRAAFQNNRRYKYLFKSFISKSNCSLFLSLSFSYAGVTNIELAYTQLDVNQCPGDHFRNAYANSAVCDRNAFVSTPEFNQISVNDILSSANHSMVSVYKVVVTIVSVIRTFVIQPMFEIRIDRHLINILRECHLFVNPFAC